MNLQCFFQAASDTFYCMTVVFCFCLFQFFRFSSFFFFFIKKKKHRTLSNVSLNGCIDWRLVHSAYRSDMHTLVVNSSRL